MEVGEKSDRMAAPRAASERAWNGKRYSRRCRCGSAPVGRANVLARLNAVMQDRQRSSGTSSIPGSWTDWACTGGGSGTACTEPWPSLRGGVFCANSSHQSRRNRRRSRPPMWAGWFRWLIEAVDVVIQGCFFWIWCRSFHLF